MKPTKLNQLKVLEEEAIEISKSEIDELEYFLNSLGNQLFEKAKDIEKTMPVKSKLLYKTALRIYMTGFFLEQMRV